MFCFCLEYFDVSELIEDKKVGLFIEGLNEDVISNNLTYLLDNTNVGVTVMEAHPKYSELFPDEYGKAKRFLRIAEPVHLPIFAP